MKLIRVIGKPLQEIVFFLICLVCIVAPTINYLLLLYTDISLDVLFVIYISIAVTISYLLTSIVYLTKKHVIVKFLLYFFVLSLLAIYLFLKISFSTNISPLLITMIAETNQQESYEFTVNYIFSRTTLISLLITSLLIIIAWIGERRNIKIKSSLQQVISILVLCCMVVAFYNLRIVKSLTDCKSMSDVNTWYDRYYPYAMDNISILMYSLYIPHITSSEIEQAILQTEKATKEKAEISINDSLNVVFVIGESYIKYHAHLYGYPLPTTPYMDKEHNNGNLYVFQNIISPYNTTTQAMKTILSTNSIADGESWSEGIYFPAVFKNAGYNVYLWDNQKTLGTFLIYTYTVNSLMYSKRIQELSYTDINDCTYQYDEQLIDSFLKKEKTGKYRFIIFHLMGQHVMASERYPSMFNRFKSKDILRKERYLDDRKKQLIAEYDNATLYNDYVMGKLFNQYRNDNAVIVMTSDHGEEIYDFRDAKGRNLDFEKNKNVIKYQNDIPFVIWCSDKYKQKYPDIIKDIENATDRKGMSDNVCQLLFKIAHIHTTIYKSNKDISSPNYQQTKRIVYDSYDYDVKE